MLVRLCIVKGCNKRFKAKGYCDVHWYQFHKYGEIRNRNRLSDNEFVVIGETTEIILYDTYGKEKARAIIDTDDLDIAKKYKWYQNNSGYPMSRISRKNQVFLHRILIDPQDDEEVDHIDGNPLNNRRNNLRTCSHKENLKNIKIRIDNTSGHKGVSFVKRRNKWRARIQVDGKEKHLGEFCTIEEAAKARMQAEKTYYGEFARQIQGGKNK